ncbi:MAG: CsgG/HfaB family protein [bacterium]
MNLRVVRWTVAVLGLGVCFLPTAEAQKQTTESITVVEPGTGPGVRVMTKEVTTVGSADKKILAQATDTMDATVRKARVVVVPATYSKEIRSKFERELSEKFGMTDAGVIENPSYTSYLVDGLVNSRKLVVLERENLEPAIKELNFGESDYADVAKVVKLGRMLNADFVVIPEIRYFMVELENKTVPYIGQQESAVKGKLATNVRTVDVATSQIVSSNISDAEKKTKFRKSRGPVAQQMRDFVGAIYGQSVVAEASVVIDTAYPIRVVGVNPGECIINRGKGAITVGEELSVYQTGEDMIDPDTKESLGPQETKIGRVKVIEVNEKTSKAQMLEGGDAMKKSYICRREKTSATAAPAEQVAPKLD